MEGLLTLWSTHTKSECTFLSNVLWFPKELCFWKVPGLSPFVLPSRVTCKLRWAWSIGGIVSTRETRIMRRKTCPSAILSNTNLTWTEVGSNSGPRRERPANNCLSLSTTRSKRVAHLNNISRFNSHITVHSLHLRYKNWNVYVVLRKKSLFL